MAATAARVLSSIQSNDVNAAQYNAVADVLARTGHQLPANSSAPSALSRTFEAVSELQQFLLNRLVRLGRWWACYAGQQSGTVSSRV